MSITNGYVTREELINHIVSNGGGQFSPEDDGNLDLSVEACSRWLDEYYKTSFYARTETRYLTAEFSDLVYLDDLLTITTLKTDTDGDETYATTWATTDYWLEPRNAQSRPTPSPYTRIRINRNGDYSFPTIDYGIEIAGTWGYSSTAPKVIKQLCLLLAHRIWKRKDSIFGIAGSPELGVTVIQAKVTVDSDIQMLMDSAGAIGVKPFYHGNESG